MAAAVKGRAAMPTKAAAAATASIATHPSAATPPLAPIPEAAPSFPSHRDVPPGSLHPDAFALCEILMKTPQAEVEQTLARCGIPPLPEHVEAVLRHSYGNAANTIRFFRWAAGTSPHTPVAWNLMVDLLGRNGLFEAMWDAIRSMRDEPSAPLAPATFVSIFGSYCSAGRIKEAIMSFDVMDRYGVPQDTFAVNSLLSAICRLEGHTMTATELFDRVKTKVTPDADTFAILLEGWEKEGNVSSAKKTFGEMVVRLGWDPNNMSAHDAFLSTLVQGGEAGEALKFLQVMKSKGCLPGMKFFANALDILVRQRDLPNASALWETMVGNGLVPNTVMYNAMIALYCDFRSIDSAWKLLDEMPFQGAFPDLLTYNTIFESLVKSKRVRDTEKFLEEMKKNEYPPSSANCLIAIKMFFEEFDPEAAVKVWNYIVEETIYPNEECANELLAGLCGLSRVKDVRNYAEDMLDMKIQLQPNTMLKLKGLFQKTKKMDAYDRIEKRLKLL